MLAPFAWLSRVSRRSCLVTRSTFGSSLFGGILAGVAADVTWRRAVALDLTLLFLDAAVLRFRDFAMEGVDIFRLHWFAAPDLTLARPKAPQIARRALSVSPGGHVHRPAPIAMRPLRQKSSRFLSRGALEASQSRGLPLHEDSVSRCRRSDAAHLF